MKPGQQRNKPMGKIPSRRTIAKRAGYSIREGEYLNTTDNRLGRWYVIHENDEFFRPWGAGYSSQKAAWEAAAEQAERN